MNDEEHLKEICFHLFGGTYEDLAKKVLKEYWNGNLDKYIKKDTCREVGTDLASEESVC